MGKKISFNEMSGAYAALFTPYDAKGREEERKDVLHLSCRLITWIRQSVGCCRLNRMAYSACR
jgi:hypothetical protein